MRTNSESEDNKLLASAAFLVAELLGVMKKKKNRKMRKIEKNLFGKSG